MIQETYCSFEVAKLLKEKGFDTRCCAGYTSYGQFYISLIQQYNKDNLLDCIAPNPSNSNEVATGNIRNRYCNRNIRSIS